VQTIVAGSCRDNIFMAHHDFAYLIAKVWT
jgi:hypothetical protein